MGRGTIACCLVAVSAACSATSSPDASGPASDPQAPGVVTTSRDGTTFKDGVKNGDETDVDCGGSSGAKCVTGNGCAKADDCESSVCTSSTCAAPSAADGVKNGDETDVDCGGTSGKPCGLAKVCKVHADCSTACLDGACSYAKSCRSHFGGATCGGGEPGEAGAKLEDCCTTVAVPRPVEKGGPFTMDKYLITAGRMRAFITAVNDDVRTWAENNPPLPDWNATWGKSVPANATDVAQQLGAGQEGATSYPTGSLGPGCYAKGKGAPAYWLPDDVQANANGDMPRALTQDELDTKVMNCATRALFTAFCAWDGGRLPKYADWQYAVRGEDSTRKYPWGSAATIGNFASYDFNYAWPTPVDANELDRGASLPAPGRFPQGVGPFGHMDLVGAVENFSADTGGWIQYSFQEAGKELAPLITYGMKTTKWGPSTKHWAIGARCVRSM